MANANIDIDGVDTERGIRSAFSDEAFYKELLGIFLESHGGAAAEIEAALAAGRRDNAIHLVHTIRSEAGIVGAEELQRRATICEAALREGHGEDLQTALEDFKAALERILKSIAAFLDLGR